jgi:hypothetical protein
LLIMPGQIKQGGRAAAVTWALVAEIGLGTTIDIWSLSASAAARAGYGRTTSTVLLAISMLATGIGGVLVLLRRGHAWLAVPVVLAVLAGGIVPLILTDMTSPGGSGDSLLLVLATVGMCLVATYFFRGRSNGDNR